MAFVSTRSTSKYFCTSFRALAVSRSGVVARRTPVVLTSPCHAQHNDPSFSASGVVTSGPRAALSSLPLAAARSSSSQQQFPLSRRSPASCVNGSVGASAHHAQQATSFPPGFFRGSTRALSSSSGVSSAVAGSSSSSAGDKIDFTDTRTAYAALPTSALARALAIFALCGVKPLVTHSDALVRAARRSLGDAAVAAMMRPTFFAHFCAGEDGESIKPTIARLQRSGIGGILDYAAEADLASSPTATGAFNAAAAAAANSADSTSAAGVNTPAAANTASAMADVSEKGHPRYSKSVEASCDHHEQLFLKCITAVRDSYDSANTSHNHDAAAKVAAKGSEAGFSAIKLTALADPVLLERGTTLVNAFRAVFPAPAFPSAAPAPATGVDLSATAPLRLTAEPLAAFLAATFPALPAPDRAATAARLLASAEDPTAGVSAKDWALGFSLSQIQMLARHAAAGTGLAAVLLPPGTSSNISPIYARVSI